MEQTIRPPGGVVRDLVDVRDHAQARVAHLSEGARLYHDRFLGRVNSIRNELSLLGIVDARLDQANANPAIPENVQAISDRLQDIATRLPDNSISELASLHEANTRLQNTAAHQQDEVARLIKQVNTLTDERPRILTAEQSRQIAMRMKSWPGGGDDVSLRMQLRRVLVLASPKGHDASTYASQIRLAFERGNIWSEGVLDFTYGDDISGALGEYEEVNREFLLAHDANVTIWGSDTTEHAGEPLDRALLDAFSAAGVDVTHHPGPKSIGGEVAVIIGRGAVTKSERQEQKIAQLESKLSRFKPRHLSDFDKDTLRSRLEPLNTEWVATGHEGIQIFVHATGGYDCADYAREFEDFFRSIGFRVHQSGLSIYVEHDYHFDLWVRWDSARERDRGMPAVGAALAHALDEIGVEQVNAFDYPGHSPLDLIVGSRRSTST